MLKSLDNYIDSVLFNDILMPWVAYKLGERTFICYTCTCILSINYYCHFFQVFWMVVLRNYVTVLLYQSLTVEHISNVRTLFATDIAANTNRVNIHLGDCFD